MSGYATSVKDYVERYKAEVGSDGLLDPHAVAEWAYSQGLHKPSLRTVIDAIATDIAQVFREEYRVDGAGRRYRAKHAAMQRRGNKSLSLWPVTKIPKGHSRAGEHKPETQSPMHNSLVVLRLSKKKKKQRHDR